jgi:hypothetical protein
MNGIVFAFVLCVQLSPAPMSTLLQVYTTQGACQAAAIAATQANPPSVYTCAPVPQAQ